MASQKGHPDVSEMLIEHHADVNIQEEDGETALHLAAFYGHSEVAQVLLDNGADPDIVNEEGATPFDLASDRHHEIAQLLEPSLVGERNEQPQRHIEVSAPEYHHHVQVPTSEYRHHVQVLTPEYRHHVEAPTLDYHHHVEAPTVEYRHHVEAPTTEYHYYADADTHQRVEVVPSEYERYTESAQEYYPHIEVSTDSTTEGHYHVQGTPVRESDGEMAEQRVGGSELDSEDDL
jgi:hypothetical protein